MSTRNSLIVSAALVMGLSATDSQAALESRLGGQAVYDTDLNITWLSDANLAATNTFGLATGVDLGPNIGVTNSGASAINNDGTMTWGGALKWIEAMNASNYLGFNDWRLPTTLQPDATCSVVGTLASYGSWCTGSEMGHLYYTELGGVSGGTTTHNVSYNLFENVQATNYWSGTELKFDPSRAWLFNMSLGGQNVQVKSDWRLRAWAVRPGDVAVVPEAQIYVLMLAGLGLVGAAVRRREQAYA